MPDTRNRLLVRTTAPATEPVTLSEAKLYLRVDTTADDTLIGDLIVAARLSAEQWLRSSLITQSWKIAFDDCIEECVALPMGPVTSITSIVGFARDNSSQTVSSAGYYLSAANDLLLLDAPVYATRIEITYVTGFGTASQVPTPIKQGLLAHIAALYDARGIWNDTGIPAQSVSLYAPFRLVKL